MTTTADLPLGDQLPAAPGRARASSAGRHRTLGRSARLASTRRVVLIDLTQTPAVAHVDDDCSPASPITWPQAVANPRRTRLV